MGDEQAREELMRLVVALLTERFVGRKVGAETLVQMSARAAELLRRLRAEDDERVWLAFGDGPIWDVVARADPAAPYHIALRWRVR